MSALDLDWEAIKTLAIAIGIKPAAERLGIMQHLDALYQRSKREGWLANVPRSQPLPTTVLRPVSCVSSASVAMANTLRDKAQRVRINHLEASLTASEELAQLSGRQLLDPDMADILLKHGKHAAVVGGWNADTSANATGKAFGRRGHVIEVDPDSSVILQELDTQECSTAETGQIGSDYQG